MSVHILHTETLWPFLVAIEAALHFCSQRMLLFLLVAKESTNVSHILHTETLWPFLMP